MAWCNWKDLNHCSLLALLSYIPITRKPRLSILSLYPVNPSSLYFSLYPVNSSSLYFFFYPVNPSSLYFSHYPVNPSSLYVFFYLVNPSSLSCKDILRKSESNGKNSVSLWFFSCKYVIKCIWLNLAFIKK